MDLTWGDVTEVSDEPWKSVGIHPTNDNRHNSCKVWVKLNDMSERYAYYYSDRGNIIPELNLDVSHFWDCHTKRPLHDVILWKTLKPNPEEASSTSSQEPH